MISKCIRCPFNTKEENNIRLDRNYLMSWVGGKRLLRNKISELIPDTIETYVEPFGGGGWVLFFKEKWAQTEVYNDLDCRLVNLFKIVKYHPDELIKELTFHLNSRKIFKEYLGIPGETDIQKAARFLYVIMHSFGATGHSFAVKRAISHENVFQRIENIFYRLGKVVIENLDFEKLITLYDGPGSFFYCDPPYSKGKGYETTSCEGFDHERLSNILRNIKGKFLLSYDNSPLIRDLYKDFNIIEISRQKGINNKNPKGREYKEFIITNYEVEEKCLK